MPNTIVRTELWAPAIQVPFEKSLVAKAIADTQWGKYKKAQQVHFPSFGSFTANTYTPGTSVTPQAISMTDEVLIVDQIKEITLDVDRTEVMQTNYSWVPQVVREAGLTLASAVDTDVLAEALNANATLDAGDFGGTAGEPLAVTTSNILQVFSKARRKLQENDADKGELFAVLTPAGHEVLVNAGFSSGFDVADAYLRNGFIGTVAGFRVYVSNNINSGAYGTGTAYNWLFGRVGSIALAIQKEPGVERKDVPDQLADRYIVWTMWGVKTFSTRAKGLVRVAANM